MPDIVAPVKKIRVVPKKTLAEFDGELSAGGWAKMVFFDLLFVASAVFFAYASRNVGESYMKLFYLSPQTVQDLILLAASILCLFVFAGLMASFTKNVALRLSACLLAPLGLFLFYPPTLPVIIAASIFFVFSLLYVWTIQHIQSNQIHQTFHPLMDGKSLLTFIAVGFLSFSFSLALAKDMSARSFILPPELKQLILTKVEASNREAVLKQIGPKATPVQRDMALAQLRKSLSETYDQIILGTVTPYKQFIPAAFGLVMFSALYFLVLPLSYLAMLVLWLLLLVLRALNVVITEKVMQEITRFSV